MSINIGLIHVGEAIKERLRTLKMTQAEFAKMLGMEQPSVNAMLKKSSMDTEKLKLISIQLDYNFFEEFCPDLKQKSRSEKINAENVENGTVPVSLYREARDENKELTQKIIELEKEVTNLSNQLRQHTNIEKERTVV